MSGSSRRSSSAAPRTTTSRRSEDGAGWLAFLRSLRARGLKGVFTRTLLADELREIGFIVDAAASVEEALSILVVHHPDAVIVDVYLDKGPSGVDLAQTLREDPTTAFTFIIALSGHYAPECLRLALDAGCDRFLVKPCPTELLVETIQDFLSNRAGAATG